MGLTPQPWNGGIREHTVYTNIPIAGVSFTVCTASCARVLVGGCGKTYTCISSYTSTEQATERATAIKLYGWWAWCMFRCTSCGGKIERERRRRRGGGGGGSSTHVFNKGRRQPHNTLLWPCNARLQARKGSAEKNPTCYCRPCTGWLRAAEAVACAVHAYIRRPAQCPAGIWVRDRRSHASWLNLQRALGA